MDASIEEIMQNSTLAAGMIRGLSKIDIEHPPGTFRFINCLERVYESKNPVVTSIKFSISRYEEYSHVIKFDPPVSEQQAIVAAEAYLSEPLTKEYFERIANDLFDTDLPWESANKNGYICRGDCLTDARFIEDTQIVEGELTLMIGS